MNKEDIKELHHNLYRTWNWLVEEGRLDPEVSAYGELDVHIGEIPAHKRYNKQEHTVAVFALAEDIGDTLNPGDDFHELGKLSQRMTEHKEKRMEDL